MAYQLNTFQSKTVVVVEDDCLVLELAVSELEDSGFRVVGFPTADAALIYLRMHGADTEIVVTDVQMPGTLNGLQLTEIVSRICPGVPVLVTSGGSLVDPARLPACAKFLRKPWRPDDMVARVRTLMASAAVKPPYAGSAVSTSFSQ